ncbi:hypothetical protein PPYC1_19865 [Paenibacillus polymyxa]|uniref:hypothetical protein n=1 Tax=Paenibacillus polymyxa TaxID=1406 RepID=UPI0008FC7F7F|nr:hypothetical protein [Paenibacillus polymyxa]APB72491.1 hypothetical protein PPYC1_19865 [Paenibacillus polymyxa]
MLSQIVHDFLKRFYALPNLLIWDKINTGDYGDRFKPYLARLEGEYPTFTVLPYMEQDKSFTWFAIAFNENSFTQVREVIRSFVGTTYSSMDFYQVDNFNHIQDENVRIFTNGHFFKFRGNDKAIGQKVQDLFRLLRERPERGVSIPTDPAPLLRTFELALQAGEHGLAEAQIVILERHNLIDPRNALFMRIEMLSRLNCWKEILIHPQMEDLLKSPRPARVTEGIIRAVYSEYLETLESDSEIMKKVFSEEIWPVYQSLFRVRGSLTHPHVLMCFMLRSVMPEEPMHELRNEILSLASGQAIEPLLRSLTNDSTSITETLEIAVFTLEEAKSLADNSRYEEAFKLAVQLPLSKEQIQLLLICAYELQDLTIDKQVVDLIFQSTTIIDWKSILTTRHLRTCFEYLYPLNDKKSNIQESNVSATLPGSWNEWFDKMEDFDLNQATMLARRGAVEWHRDGFLDNSAEMEKFKNFLKDGSKTTQDTLNLSMLYLLRFFSEDTQWPREELKDTYGELHRIFLSHMQGTSEEMKISSVWLRTLLNLGLPKDQYRSLFEDLTVTWRKYASREYFSTLVPVLSQSADIPCPDLLSRCRLVHQVQDLASKNKNFGIEEWVKVEDKLIPKDWDTYFGLLHSAQNDYQFLADWYEQIQNKDIDWTPTSALRVNDYFIDWIVEEPESIKRSILARALLPFVQFIVQYRDFPRIDDVDLYENVAEAMRIFSNKNEETLQSLIKLLDGLLLKKPGEADAQWRYMKEWLTFQPILRLLSSIFDCMELFRDYGVPGMEIKPVWDEWVGRLYDKFEKDMDSLRDYLILLGEEVSGNYDVLELLRKQVQDITQDNSDPLQKLKNMKITIFSCREKAANRAADQIMKRNSLITVNVCTSDRATDQTTAYARNSDLSVVVTACISHALTYGIKDHLSYEPIYPRSSGEAGIITRLEEYAMSLNAS